MAMAFAPIVLCHAPFVVNEPEVVSKSYPDYWKKFTVKNLSSIRGKISTTSTSITAFRITRFG